MTVAKLDLLAAARAELESRIRRRQLDSAEDMRVDFPAVWDDPDSRLELIYSEYVLRAGNGEQPNRSEWFDRYSDLRERLDRLFGLYDLMTSDAANMGTASSAAGPHADTTHPAGYEVLSEIGRGGMAVVYRARQESLNRVVALKVLRWGDWNEADDYRRACREAELVARLQHPNIVQVHEVGEWDGSPYLALEYVSGGTLADALTRLHKQGQTAVATMEAITLVGLLARAVEAAHEQGVVHRDLKPANVLLADDPSGPFARPKITDFGLAIATDVSPAVSQTVAIAGTPCYMAPEQAEARRAAVGPRTDVYALGGILYELLTGRPPFQGATVLETLDLVRHAEPVSPRQLRPNLPRDLETICLKCLEKDPARRYESAARLADDLESFRQGRPIAARPVGPLETGWKWCRRRPLVAGLAVGLATALGLGIAGVTREYFRAETERKNAIVANGLTAQRLEQIELINDTMLDIFDDLDVKQARAYDQPVEAQLADRLVEVGKRLDAHAIADPLVLANLRNRLGKTLVYLGKAPVAIEFLSAAHKQRATSLGPDHEDTISALGDLGTGYWEAGRADEAMPVFEETRARSQATLGADHRHTLDSANNLAMAYRDTGKIDQAIPLLEQTVARQEKLLGPADPDTISGMSNLAFCYLSANQQRKALPLLEKVLARRKDEDGRDQFSVLAALNNLATTYQDVGEMDRAIPLFEEALALKRTRLGLDHQSTLTGMANLALAYQYAQRMDLALPLYEETLKLRRKVLGIDHELTLLTMANLASGYQYGGQHERAIPLYKEAMGLQSARLGPDHESTLITMNNLALCLRDVGQPDEALPLHETVLERQRNRTGPDDSDTHFYMTVLANAYDAVGRYDDAERLHRERLDSVVKVSGTSSAAYASAAAALGRSFLTREKWTDAEPLLREALAIRQEQRPDNWLTAHTTSLVGEALLGQKNFKDAEPLLIHGYDGLKTREDAIPKAGGPELFIPEALDRLILLYTGTDRPEEAKRYRDLRSAYPPPKETK